MNQPQVPTPEPAPSLDQYKAYLSDLGNIGTRYTTSNGFYLSVITALMGILALTKVGEIFERPKTYLGLVVSVFAVLVCLVWRRSVTDYAELFKIKFEVLREMEQKGNLFPIFKYENDKRGKLSLLKNDRRVPLLLCVPFLLAFIYLAWKVI